MNHLNRGPRLALALPLLAMGAVGLAPAASATPVFGAELCISDSSSGCGAGDSVTLLWNGTFSDSTTGSGAIDSASPVSGDTGLSVTASLGTFTLSISTGLYEPSPGTAMDLNSVDVNSASPGTLYIFFGADNYTGSSLYNEAGSVTLNPGATSATDTACYQPASGTFTSCGHSGAPIIGSGATTTTGALDFTSSVLPPTSTYGLAENLQVTFSGAGTFSGDLSLVSTPEPGTMALVGCGLTALGLLRRRKSGR